MGDSVSNNQTSSLENVTISSGKEIYFDYDKVKDFNSTISDSNSSLTAESKELQTLVTDLGTYWSGTLKDTFVEIVQSYIDVLDSYNKIVQSSYDKLTNASNAYSTLDNEFASKEI